MRRLSLIFFVIGCALLTFAQESPHGDQLSIACKDCHTTEGWKMIKGTYSFNHNTTQFPLIGQHLDVNCTDCHQTLVFNQAQTDCASCHMDMHQETVGRDCDRCHTPHSWLVSNITEIHQLSRFPLLGAHATADCQQCHPSASQLLFEPLSVECFACHQQDYINASSPNHVEANYSKVCTDCHNLNAFSWSGEGIDHSFFPLVEGHAIGDCFACHTEGNDYSNISSECISCHQLDYNNSTNPSHFQIGLSTECTNCHTLAPGWKPASFTEHDPLYFPIYSGSHNGEWGNCSDCHPNAQNYSQFTCTNCHEHNQGDMDDEHEGVGGYVYNDQACFDCHPTGDEEGAFNHNDSQFPLTGAHLSALCLDCHDEGYSGTPTACYDCHVSEYMASLNPSHTELELAQECEDCHTTAPEWKPATFDVHNDYYPLLGAHNHVASDCFACHEGNYVNSPNTCFGCHAEEYTATTNPGHVQLNLSQECEQCHTEEPEWKPATFEIHNEYYPLQGAHNVIASDCFSCHEGNYVNTPNTCFGCHADDYNQTNDPPHASAQFSTDCLLCHTESAWEPSTFEHDNAYFPIYSGSHKDEWNTCGDCHPNISNYAIFSCIDCHEHNQADMDSEHEDVQDYIYASQACLDCHPDGEESLHRNVIRRIR